MPKTQELTISKATAQARRLVDKIMPGAMATVESKRSYDLAADRATIVTTITHPVHPSGSLMLYVKLQKTEGLRKVEQFPNRTIVTRDI